MRVSAVRAADRTDTDTRGEADSAEISTQGSSALESDQLPSSGRDGDTLCFFFFFFDKAAVFSAAVDKKKSLDIALPPWANTQTRPSHCSAWYSTHRRGAHKGRRTIGVFDSDLIKP